MTEALVAFALTVLAHAALVVWLWPKMRTPPHRPPLSDYERRMILMRRAVDDAATNIGLALLPALTAYGEAVAKAVGDLTRGTW